MDSKYYALVELTAFTAIAVGFCVYQIWSVRRKPDDEDATPAQLKDRPIEHCGRIYGALNHNATRSFVA
jgi:hypothetical protein